MPERLRGLNPSEGTHLSQDDEYRKRLADKQEKLGRFKPGQTVNVKRSSGEMEGDWFITGYNDKEDKVVVMKKRLVDEVGVMKMKMVQKTDLESWNPE